MGKIEKAIKSDSLIGPITVEPRREKPPLPKEFEAVGRLFQFMLTRFPSGGGTYVEQMLRLDFHQLLNQAIDEACRKGR